MTCTFITIYIIFNLFTVVTLAKKTNAAQEYRGECSVWQTEIERIQREEHRIRVNCSVNAQCTGFDCNGVYIYNGRLTAYQTYQKTICFGLWINPCSTPSELTVYIEQTTDNVTFTHSKSNDGHQDVNVPGIEEIADLQIYQIKAKLTVGIDVTHLKKHNKPYMIIGLQLKPKIKYTKSDFTYPESMKVTLVKDVEVEVPKCDRSVPLTKHTPHKCPKLEGKSVIQPNITCKSNQLYLCDQNNKNCFCANETLTKECQHDASSGNIDICDDCQACSHHLGHNNQSNQWYCWYIPRHHLVDGLCVHNDKTTPIPIIDGEPGNLQPHSTSKNNVIIIASCSVVAIVLALLATSFVVWRYLKHRAHYSTHSLLRNQDDDYDGDVPPIDLET